MKDHKKKDIRNVIQRESRYSKEASAEAKDTKKVLSKEKKSRKPESVKDDEWELKVDKKFAAIRKRKAKKEISKLKGLR